MNRCTLAGLRTCQKGCVKSFVNQLRQKGFAVVTVDDDERQNGLQKAMHQAAKLPSFRFPPVEGDIVYNEPKREAFQSLFSVATTCLTALLSDTTKTDHKLQAALKEAQHMELFAASPNEPFQVGQPFSQSFFNLFNYSHGLLNPHVDRSLLTVISSSSPAKPTKGRRSSTLWIQDSYGKWRDGDEASALENQVIIMVGEELASNSVVPDLFAAMHAVKVRPEGENFSRAHFRPDPETHPTDNRLSAALILRHEHARE